MAAAPSPIDASRDRHMQYSHVSNNTAYVSNVQTTDSAGIAAQGFAFARDFAQRAAVHAADTVASIASARHETILTQQRDAILAEASQAQQRDAKASAEERQRLEASAREQEALLRSQGQTLLINERVSSSAALSAAQAQMAAQTQHVHELQSAVQDCERESSAVPKPRVRHSMPSSQRSRPPSASLRHQDLLARISPSMVQRERI
jgi:hypothetical protein